MPRQRSTYTAEFKLQAAQMITDQKLAVAEVARRLGVAVALLAAAAGCGGKPLPLEGTRWSSVAKKDAKQDPRKGSRRTPSSRGAVRPHAPRPPVRRRLPGGRRHANFEVRQPCDPGPGTLVGYTVILGNDNMVLRQTAGDGPALTTMGQVIEFKRVE